MASSHSQAEPPKIDSQLFGGVPSVILEDPYTDEQFESYMDDVFRAAAPGDAFILGASTWKIVDITHDRVEVVPAPGEPGATMPFWHGDMMGRPLETGRALGAFVREIGALPRPEAMRPS